MGVVLGMIGECSVNWLYDYRIEWNAEADGAGPEPRSEAMAMDLA